MNSREFIYSVIRFALAGRNGELEAFPEADAADWEYAFSVLSMHGLAAFAFDLIEGLPAGKRPPKEVVLKFISADLTGRKAFAKLNGLAGKIDGLMKENGLKCLLLKGLSLAEYYPRPEVRKFLDVDLYAPGAEAEVDRAFRAKGVAVDMDFYRHSHMTLGGVLVENHYCLLDVRGRKGLQALDADLKAMALKRLEDCDGPGLYYPDARFSLIFNLHHAMSHFIYEGISFKFLVDWVLFLRRERALLTTDQTAASLRKHGLLKFAAVMSEVAVRHLGLDMDDVPECIRTEMTLLRPAVVDRFVDDLFRPYERIHQKNIVMERLNNVRRIIKASWKPKEFLGQSAVGFVWDKSLPILMGRKVEAD